MRILYGSLNREQTGKSGRPHQLRVGGSSSCSAHVHVTASSIALFRKSDDYHTTWLTICCIIFAIRHCRESLLSCGPAHHCSSFNSNEFLLLVSLRLHEMKRTHSLNPIIHGETILGLRVPSNALSTILRHKSFINFTSSFF